MKLRGTAMTEIYNRFAGITLLFLFISSLIAILPMTARAQVTTEQELRPDMRRALAAFRASEFRIIPAPVDHIGVIAPGNILNWLPDAGALFMTSIACKEYIGWFYYRLRGWIKD